MIPDEILSFFLSAKERKKIRLLIILSHQTVKLDDIREDLKISERVFTNLKKELVSDLCSTFKDQNKSCDSLTDIDELISNLKTEYPDILLKKVILLYVNQSSIYNLLIYLLEVRNTTIREISIFFNYSESHCYKLINKLREFFSFLNLEIVVDRNVNIKGDENQIIFLNYFCLLYGFNNLSWPFRNISENKVISIQKDFNNSRYRDLSPNNKNKLNFLTAIFENSFSENNYKEELSNDVKSIVSILYDKDSTGLIDYLKKNHGYSNNLSINEIGKFILIADYLIPELKIKSEKNVIAERLRKIKLENTIIKYILSFIEKLKHKFGFSREVENHILYSVCNRIIVINDMKLYKFMSFNKTNQGGDVLGKKISEYMRDTIFMFCKEESQQSIDYSIRQWLLSFLNPSKSLKVYIELYYNPEYKEMIENNLRVNYPSERLDIVDKYHDADLIISDTPLLKNEKGKIEFYYFVNIFDKQAWLNLNIYLSKKLFYLQIYDNEIELWK